MKKHLAIVCGVYYPDPSPIGVCVQNIVDVLRGEFDIDIFCLSGDNFPHEVILPNGVSVHAYCAKRNSAEIQSNKFARLCAHIINGLQIKLLPLGNLSWFRRSTLRALKSLHQKHRIDVVLTTCSPFAAHCAGMDFKRTSPQVKVISYTVDSISARTARRPFLVSRKKLLGLEQRVYSSVDCVLLSEELYKNRPELLSAAQKCVPLPYILPKFSGDAHSFGFKVNGIHCVYAGRFYENLRNPEYMLSMFSNLRDKGVYLHLFSVGCDAIVNKYLCENIVLHSRVPHNQIAGLYACADILVSLGNSSPEFAPSKTFEYIASGKPILDFYFKNNEASALSEYPLCLRVCCDDESREDASRRIFAFIDECAGSIVDYDTLNFIFDKNTKPHLRKILCSILN